MSDSQGRPGAAAGDGRYDPLTLSIGVLGRPHGVRGEIALRFFNFTGEPPDELGAVILERDGERHTRQVTGMRPCANGLLLTFAGIDSREEAAVLTRSHVRVARAELPALAPGEYYVSDIIGCRVLAEGGASLGLVAQTFWNGAHDIMVVRSDDEQVAEAERERLIPLVPEFVREVDVGGRQVRVAWDGGA
jgi:16S rRNA processing protein RimM